MTDNPIIEKCEFLVKNRQSVREVVRNDEEALTLAACLCCAAPDKEADAQKLKDCVKRLKANKDILSEYTGRTKLLFLAKMSLNPDPEAYLKNVTEAAGKLKPFQCKNSSDKLLAAMIICEHAENGRLSDAIKRMAQLYHGMKEKHPAITGDEDLPFAAMLAVSGNDPQVLLNEAENCYHELGTKLRDKNAVQSLSHLLAPNPKTTKEKCDKVIQILELLKVKRHKTLTISELVAFGSLTLLDIPVQTAITDMLAAEDYFRNEEDISGLSTDYAREIYASLMVINAHRPPAGPSQEDLYRAMMGTTISLELCMEVLMTTTIRVPEAHYSS